MTIFELNFMWFQIAPTYYWLMYAISFILGYLIIKKRKKIDNKILDDLLLYIFLWIILWWRFWYVLFYNFWYYIDNLSHIFKLWEWWMSFHGWVIWVIIAMILFAKKYKINFYSLSDEITAILPIWLGLGRIWNHINWELLGYSWYTWILAVYKDSVWYFPSPLLEALLEWLVLFIILNYIYKKKSFAWQIASLFLILYWIFRLFVEIFFRTPDSHIWYIFWFLTMWEILTIPMIIWWIYFYNKLRLWQK